MEVEALRGPAIVAFLHQLLRQIRGKLLVIWDGTPIHRCEPVKVFLFCTAACSETVEQANTTSQKSPAPSGERNSTLDEFLHRPITGDRPFQSVARYMEWLAQRPGTDSYAVEESQTPAGEPLVRIALVGESGEQVLVVCAGEALAGYIETGNLWIACPQQTRLWTAFTPTMFATWQEARRHLLPIPVSTAQRYRITGRPSRIRNSNRPAPGTMTVIVPEQMSKLRRG